MQRFTESISYIILLGNELILTLILTNNTFCMPIYLISSQICALGTFAVIQYFNFDELSR